MDVADRDRRLGRRELLQARLKRRAEGEFCDPVMMAMRRGQFHAARVCVLDQMTVVEPFTLLPGIDERIDWPRIPDHQCRSWTTRSERSVLLDDALEDLGVLTGTRVLIVFHPSFAGIRTTRAGLVAYADAVLDANPEVWVCGAEGGGWLIESADHEICWARLFQS